MAQSSYRQTESGLVARAVPSLLTLLVALLSASSTHLMGSGEITPLFTFLCIFYWGVYSPGALPYLFIFVLGLLQDALAGTPLGMSSFINIGLAYLLNSQRQLMGRALFGAVWVSCMVLVLAATMTEWSIMCLYSGKTYPLELPLIRAAVTAIAYPPMHLLLTQVYKRLRAM